MTIYECLGIAEFLVKEEISIHSIYCALSDYNLKLEGHSFFEEIQKAFVRARLCRKGINLVVMEIRLRSSEHIREISFLLQKAISENILFVFVYGNKYIIVRRNFDLTKQSKTIHTDYISFTSNWIYKECLADAIVCNYDLAVYTYNEDVQNISGEELYPCEKNIVIAFEDFFGEIKRFCKCVSKEEISCIRYVADWIRIHAIGYRINIYDVLDVVKRYEGYQVIEDCLFLEKNCVCAAINELNPSIYFTSLDYTGTYPLQYFIGIKKEATYKEAERLKHYLLYDSEKYSDARQDVENIPQWIQELGLIKYEKWHSNRRAFVHEYKRNGYIDNIVKGYYYGEISKTRGVSLFLIRKLQKWGYTFWNELQGINLDTLEGLTQTEYVKLLYYLDALNYRPQNCSVDEYPQIEKFIRERFCCEECGRQLKMSAWHYKGRLCDKCTTRINHILLNTEMNVEVLEYRSRVTPLKRSIDAKIEFNFGKSGRGRLKDAFLIMQDGTSYICEKIDWKQREYNCIENRIEILFSWRITGNGAEDQARYLHVIWEDDAKTHNLYSFYVGNFAMNDASNNPILLSDFYPKINYCEYLVERATGEEKETLQIIVEKRDSRISVVLCVMNLSWLYVRKVYDEYYVCEDGRYYNRDKSKLIAVILPKEKQMVNVNTLNVLPNIGPILCQQLNAAGFLSVEDLMRETTEEIWSKLYEVYPSTDYIEIYAIDCAKKGIWMRDMQKARKQVLKAYVSAKKYKQ